MDTPAPDSLCQKPKPIREFTPEELFLLLHHTGSFEAIDLHLARFLCRLDREPSPELFAAVCLASHMLGQGHVCLDLASFSGRAIPDGDPILILPGTTAWLDRLRASSVVGAPDTFHPLLLDGDSRLYLYRYHRYERLLSERLLQRSSRRFADIDFAALKTHIHALFPDAGEGTDWQRVAAFAAATGRLCVVSGGPGTGKTTTVARVLALLLLQNPGRNRIGLAAPTGKAAARLQESIQQARQSLAVNESVKNEIPEKASTLHRLLGSIPLTAEYRHHDANPLPLDILVVDEASMVDLPLMTKLLMALPDETTLILLGDKDQLASVEGGAVLGDICSIAGAETFSKPFAESFLATTGDSVPTGTLTPLSDSIVMLTRSFRFSGQSGIGMLSKAVQHGDSGKALQLLQSDDYPELQWIECRHARELGGIIRTLALPAYTGLFTASGAIQALDAFATFRILTPLRKGPYGVSALNSLVEQGLFLEGTLPPVQRGQYQGRPVMILTNDYGQKLYNGDVGIIWKEEVGFKACFPAEHGVRSLSPALLPEHETAYALTVHKSQGSEFDQVLLILPDQDFPVLTRELVYTAITRAKSRLTLVGTTEVLQAAVSKRTLRSSGLADRLHSPGECFS
ncbi:MAG: exodeoxyribonuclease V subunit alpha [Desulfovibrionales bacterium]